MELRIYRRLIFTLITFLVISTTFSQAKWKSPKYGYSVEIPKGFEEEELKQRGIDLKLVSAEGSILISVDELPSEITPYSNWDLLGDLETFGDEWETDVREYMDNPKFLEYGKTKINGLETFWFDSTLGNPPNLYMRTYYVKKGSNLYTITFASTPDKFKTLFHIWNKFKNQMIL